MPINVFEQFEELYSRWSILDKVGKEMQLERMWQQVTAAYRYLLQVYQRISDCPHRSDCPVLEQLQRQSQGE